MDEKGKKKGEIKKKPKENCRIVLQMCSLASVTPEGRAVGGSYREGNCSLMGVVSRFMSKSLSMVFVNIVTLQGKGD